MTARDAEMTARALRELTTLRLQDVDAAEATSRTLATLSTGDPTLRALGEELQRTHERQIENLTEILAEVGAVFVPYARDALLTAPASQRALAAKTSLLLMRHHELTLQRAYRVVSDAGGLSAAISAVVEQGVEDQRRHIVWLTRALEALDG